MIVVAAFLGIGLVTAAILLTQGGPKEQPEQKSVAKKNEEPDVKLKIELAQSKLAVELLDGEEARFDVGPLVKDIKASDCKIEWNLTESTLPRKSLEQVKRGNRRQIQSRWLINGGHTNDQRELIG